MRIMFGLSLLLTGMALSACQTGGSGGRIATVARPDTPGADRVFDFPYLMRDLGNGLRVIIVKTDYPDIVTIQIPVQTGSRNEVEPGKSGFAHFFEHMMFRGTENYPPEVYAEMLKNAGADQNAYTTDDYTNYHVTFTKDDLETIIKLEADRFQHLSYTEDQFRTEALAVKGEYLKNYSNPIRKIFERMRDLAFTTHTYKHTTMGLFDDINNMPNQLAYSKTFFDRWYRPENTTVLLCGDVNPQETFALVKKYWGGWARGSWSVDIPEEPHQRGVIYEHIQWDAPTQPWVVVGFHGPRFDPRDKAMPSMDLIQQVYFSQTSELYQKLVIRDQLVDQLFPFFPNRKDPFLLMVGARVLNPDSAATVRDSILETFARARVEKVDRKRLQDVKSRLKYQFVSGMDNSASIGSILARYVQYDRTPETINELYRTYDAITPDDMLKYANVYFQDASMVNVTLSNEASLPNLSGSGSVEPFIAKYRSGKPVDVKMVEMKTRSPLIDVALLFRVGAADDPAGQKGLAQLTAAMITGGGSESRKIEEIDEALYPMAAGFSAQVDKEMTRLAGSVHRDNLDRWYDIISEQLLTPGWREEDFTRIKTNTISAIRTNLVGNNDEELGKEVLYEFIYGADHPYGSLTLGAVKQLESITLDDVKAFYGRFFTPENLTVGLAGGYTDAFVTRLKGDLVRLPRGSRDQLTIAPPPAIQGHQAIIVQKETPAVAVSFGCPIDVRRGDPDWVALWLARSFFGEHRSNNSHLYNRIRELRGMNYGDYAYIEYFPGGMFQFHPDANLGRHRQIFQVWIRPLRNNNDAHFATRTAMFELNKLIENGLTAEQFEATRNYLSKFVSLLVKTQSRQLGYQLDSEYYGTDAFTDYVRAGLKRLTVDQVNRVIRKHLQAEDMKFVFITKDAGDLKQRLISDQSSPIKYNTPKPELKQEDDIIQNLPLGFAADSVTVIPADRLFQ
ncbi:MAG: M16 family metallopeptidase [Phycisphaerae bacterium]